MVRLPGIVRSTFIAILLLLPGPAPSEAGIDNSHHDMRQFMPDKDTCLTCHSRKDGNEYGSLENELGRVGGLCVFLCHSGKGILPETDALVPKPGPSVDVADYSTTQFPDFTSVYFTRSHGRNPRNLKDGNGNPVPWPPAGVTWQGVGASFKLECTSCHAVHDNRFSPFLNSPLSAAFPDIDGFCERCHRERATNNLTAPPDGTHPIAFFLDAETAALRSDGRRHPRRIRVQAYGRSDGTGSVNVFDVPNPEAAALNDPLESWSMGGHLVEGERAPMDEWAEKGRRQQMGCYTCHSAHRTDLAGEKDLVVVTTADFERGWNPICTGCHGTARTLEDDRAEWNVGITLYGHSSGTRTGWARADNVYTTSVGGFRFRIGKVRHVNPQSSNRFGDRGQLLCTTCHKVHFGQPGSMAIANLGQGSRSVCKTCHNGEGLPNENDFSKGGSSSGGHNEQDSHHVTATAVDMGGRHVPLKENEPLFIRKPTWANDGTGLGDLEKGMDCADCHVFNSTAHNW